PGADNETALVVAVKVAPDMLARDIQPSRLERATEKIHDLLRRRPGTKTALIAYSGSAHLALPLTVDPRIIDFFSQALSPAVMPRPGDAPAAALALGASLLRQAAIPGAILLVTDYISAGQLAALRAFREKSTVAVHIYVFAADRGVALAAASPAAPPLDRRSLRRAAAALGASLTVVSPDDRDVRRLAGRLEKSLAAARRQRGGRWRDEGCWLLPLLLVPGILFFRRGWVVVYE
ncbi:MAG: VWA domain-containing protein, partial [Deltaproteobacteria bacterium]|nr:VWA domain-containing protein [Deltaproteobacteria bacterium]